MKLSTIVLGLCCVLAVAGCTTHPQIAMTHREDVTTQSRALAMAARNLDDTVRRQATGPAAEDAARAVTKFHEAADHFAGAAASWHDEAQVDRSFEQLIDAHVAMEHRLPDLHPDGLTKDAYAKSEHEWDRLRRVAGYAGEHYKEKRQREAGDGK